LIKQNYELSFNKSTLGRVAPGDIIKYEKQLWVVLNPVTEKNSKLIRSLVGEFHECRIIPILEEIEILTTIVPTK